MKLRTLAIATIFALTSGVAFASSCPKHMKAIDAALPNAKILIHQVSGGFQGQATDIEIAARETIALKRRLEEIFSQHSGQDIEKVSKDMERDYFLTAQEANEYGIIDRVIEHR